ncbi:predicted protein [Arabidopsis lyrata subsp. lyrata]|uniref:Predicted protein n=1 Tax=Arabidopsis lyrata subsp. lyrata TaxID=81972 RepID=D7LFE5_ARALL|nr:predicted protein [Arabidopsis lyrata subsp. lyrata]
MINRKLRRGERYLAGLESVFFTGELEITGNKNKLSLATRKLTIDGGPDVDACTVGREEK